METHYIDIKTFNVIVFLNAIKKKTISQLINFNI